MQYIANKYLSEVSNLTHFRYKKLGKFTQHGGINMKKNVLSNFKRKIAMLLAAVMALTSFGAVSAFAAEIPEPVDVVTEVAVDNVSNDAVQPRAGVETLPFGEYHIGGFTFKNTNTTPVKTVSGTKVTFFVFFKKAASDAGLGDVKLSMQVRDVNGNALSPVITETHYSAYDDEVLCMTGEINLGSAGRQVQVWFDASSAGASNGHYRSIEITDFWSYVE